MISVLENAIHSSCEVTKKLGLNKIADYIVHEILLIISCDLECREKWEWGMESQCQFILMGIFKNWMISGYKDTFIFHVLIQQWFLRNTSLNVLCLAKYYENTEVFHSLFGFIYNCLF